MKIKTLRIFVNLNERKKLLEGFANLKKEDIETAYRQAKEKAEKKSGIDIEIHATLTLINKHIIPAIPNKGFDFIEDARVMNPGTHAVVSHIHRITNEKYVSLSREISQHWRHTYIKDKLNSGESSSSSQRKRKSKDTSGDLIKKRQTLEKREQENIPEEPKPLYEKPLLLKEAEVLVQRKVRYIQENKALVGTVLELGKELSNSEQYKQEVIKKEIALMEKEKDLEQKEQELIQEEIVFRQEQKNFEPNKQELVKIEDALRQWQQKLLQSEFRLRVQAQLTDLLLTCPNKITLEKLMAGQINIAKVASHQGKKCSELPKQAQFLISSQYNLFASKSVNSPQTKPTSSEHNRKGIPQSANNIQKGQTIEQEDTDEEQKFIYEKQPFLKEEQELIEYIQENKELVGIVQKLRKELSNFEQYKQRVTKKEIVLMEKEKGLKQKKQELIQEKIVFRQEQKNFELNKQELVKIGNALGQWQQELIQGEFRLGVQAQLTDLLLTCPNKITLEKLMAGQISIAEAVSHQEKKCSEPPKQAQSLISSQYNLFASKSVNSPQTKPTSPTSSNQENSSATAPVIPVH